MSEQNSLRVEMKVGFKTRHHGKKMLTAKEPIEAHQRPRQAVSREARLLALAHRWQKLLDEGQIESQAEIARILGLTRARVSQIIDMALLSPVVQKRFTGTVSCA